MSNYNAFSLIICKVHTKRENFDSWTSGPGKATSGYLFCTTPNEMKLLEDFFMEYLRNIGANKYQRWATRWAQPTWARQGAQARPGGCCPPRPTSGAHLLVYKSFLPRIKIRGGHSGRSAAASGRNLGRSTFALRRSDSARGTSLPEGEIISHCHHQQHSHLGEGYVHQHLHSTNSSQTLVHLLCSIFLPKL